MDINEFIVKDVRCFADEQKFNIRPITFLMGENSTGKSTFLGCIHVLHSILRYRFITTPNFNDAPYDMGIFEDVVRRARGEVIKEFSLGFNVYYANNRSFKYMIRFSEKKDSGSFIKREEWQFDDSKIIFKHVHSSSLNVNITFAKKFNEFTITGNMLYIVNLTLQGNLFKYLGVKKSNRFNQVYKKFLSFLKEKDFKDTTDVSTFIPDYDLNSIAPIRSEPQRTYNPMGITHNHQGKEIPIFLRNIKGTDKNVWFDMKKKLLLFGKASGLFSGIDVKVFGQTSNEPFQLKVKANGPKSNLIDVGYGVSQVLPILVHAIVDEKTKLLMQQPEAHLHPQAQAALGSLLVESVLSNKNSFIVETHSDYLVNRVRIEIMNGKIRQEDVSLIFLEPVKNKVIAHNIEFDDQGNIIGEPEGYRKFFHNEMYDLLGF